MPLLNERIDAGISGISRILLRLSCAAALASSASLSASAAPVAGAAAPEAESRYEKERAACLNGQSNQDRATCLREAGAALGEGRQGKLNDGQTSYERNALQRCNTLPSVEREECERRMKEGSVNGSAMTGGIYREHITRQAAPRNDPPPRGQTAE